MVNNKRRLTISSAIIFLMLLFPLLHGCGSDDEGKLKEELKKETEKREEISQKYKDALNQLSEEKKRTKQLEDLLLALGEKLDLEGKSLPDELAKLKEEKTKGAQKKPGEGSSPKQAVEKLIELGDEFYSKDDYAAAIEVYTSATQIAADDVNLYQRLGRSFIKSEQYDKAIPVYEKIIKLLGKHGPKEELRQAHNNLGWLYTQEGRYNEAELAYIRAIKADPEYANAYYNLGLLYDLHLNDELGAIEAFERYIELGGEKSDAASKRLKEIRER